MRKHRLIGLALLLLAVGFALLYATCPRPLTDSECSELYRRYADLPGIRASYVKNFHLNDTLTVDVTLLEATDSASWESLKERFLIPETPPEIKQIEKYNPKSYGFRRFPKGKPDQPTDTRNLANNDLLCYAVHLRTIGIFHIENEQQSDAVHYMAFKDVRPPEF